MPGLQETRALGTQFPPALSRVTQSNCSERPGGGWMSGLAINEGAYKKEATKSCQKF